MDEIDIANERAELYLKDAINKSKKPIKESNGKCLYCNVDVDSKRAFCSSECSEDYEMEQKIMRISGYRG